MCKRKYITGIIIVFIFGIYKILVLSLIMSGIPIMREHYDIANLIANVIDIITIIILLLIFKTKVSKGGMKGWAKGICVYGLPITAFSLFYSVILQKKNQIQFVQVLLYLLYFEHCEEMHIRLQQVNIQP